MIMTSDRAKKTRFGLWMVNNRKYDNKLSAVIEAVKTGHWIHWDFNEDVFASHDWTQEPPHDLRYYYDLRARQLRQRYQHISVEFSGGADSWTVLYHFCRQGLPVDTVIHRYAGKVARESSNLNPENQWAEGTLQAWPSFKKLLELSPGLKWHTWNIEDPIMDAWAGAKIDFSVQNNFHPGGIVKIPDKAQHNPFSIPDLSSTAMIYGVDKPRIEMKNGKFYLVFYDLQTIQRSVLERQAQGIGMQDIFFYWDPDCVDLLTKQAHVVMQWLRKMPNREAIIRDKPTYMAAVNSVIYPDYYPIWQSIKPKGTFAVTHENWFINNHYVRGSSQWHNIMMDYTKILQNTVAGTGYEHFIHSDHDIHKDYKVLALCPSRSYYIGDL